MSKQELLPRALAPFVEFSGLLRAYDFAVAPEQSQMFIESVGLLGPHSMEEIYRAALATLAPPIERRSEFEALFRMVFLGQTQPIALPGEDDDDELQAFDERDGEMEPPEPDDINEVGEQATGAEVLSVRGFTESEESITFRRFLRRAPAQLPSRKSYRSVTGKRGEKWNLRRTLRDAVSRDGEVLVIPKLMRKKRLRRILLLIDVSGSMKAQTDGYLRFAHLLGKAADQMEVFTLGTRLTRVTRALRHKNRDVALASVSSLVADWDGGTRLGDALGAFLNIPRFAGFARGALVLVLSDGLERGDHSAMTVSVEKLSRLSWRLVWLTPLAGDANYSPETEALVSVLPYIDAFGNGGSAESLCEEVLNIAKRAA